MANTLSLLIIPVVVGLIVLIIEYWIIQPLKAARESEPKLIRAGKNWSTAIENATEKFKQQQPQYDWKKGCESVKIDKVHTGREHGIIILSVITDDSFRAPPAQSTPYVLAKYHLTIDLAGNVRELELLEQSEDRGGFSRFRDNFQSLPIWLMVAWITFSCAIFGVFFGGIGTGIYGLVTWFNGEAITLDTILMAILQIVIFSTVVGATIGILFGFMIKWVESL